MVPTNATIGGQVIHVLIMIQMILIASMVFAVGSLQKEINRLAKAHLDLIAVFQELLRRGSKNK
jgi:hypothetical protein